MSKHNYLSKYQTEKIVYTSVDLYKNTYKIEKKYYDFLSQHADGNDHNLKNDDYKLDRRNPSLQDRIGFFHSSDASILLHKLLEHSTFGEHHSANTGLTIQLKV